MTDPENVTCTSESTSIPDDRLYPPPPQEPLPSDCCGTGCTPCVFDLYDQEMVLWKKECDKIRSGKKLENLATDQETVLSPDTYHKFQLSSIHQVTTDSFVYSFAIPADQILSISVGQHLVLRWQGPEKTISRQYTPISSPDTKGKFEFVIKLYEEGEMSQYIKSWQVDDMVEWRGPFGHFQYKPNTHRRVVMLAAGTGIAPMIQLIRHVLDNEDDETWLHLGYSCKTNAAILCKDLLGDWSGYWNFSVVYVLSQESTENSTPVKYGERVVKGRLTETLLKNEIGDKLDGIKILVCGTKSFDKDMINYLSRLGLQNNTVFKF